MKTRQGFVSNSSTSSFMAIGYELSANASLEDIARALYGDKAVDKEIKDYDGDFNGLFEEDDYVVLDEDDGLKKGKKFFGEKYGGSEYDLVSYPFSQLLKTAERLEKALGKLITGELKMVTGTRYC